MKENISSDFRKQPKKGSLTSHLPQLHVTVQVPILVPQAAREYNKMLASF